MVKNKLCDGYHRNREEDVLKIPRKQHKFEGFYLGLKTSNYFQKKY
jgi:hypothetical protein